MTGYDPRRHHRRSIRLPGYDYAQAGAYFVTLCVDDRRCVLGAIRHGAVVLSDWGRIVAQSWAWLRRQYPYVALDAWVVMPNHLHGIIILTDGGAGARGAHHDARAYHDAHHGTHHDAPLPDVVRARRDAPCDAPHDAPTGAHHDMGTRAHHDARARAHHDAGTRAHHDAPLPDVVRARRDAPCDAPHDTPHDAPHDAPKRKPLGQLIGAFKTVSTKRINELRGTPGARFWQRNYYEHVVRDEHDLARIRRYIINNPRRWEMDRDNLANARRLPPPTAIADYLADMDDAA